MHAQLRDTNIFFEVVGTMLANGGDRLVERPSAFVLHGGPGVDHYGMRARCDQLADDLQLIYVDHRGQGRSARGDASRYTLDENVEDLEALRRHVGTGPIVSLGYSYGGQVAMAHAARYPASVEKLILISTSAHCGYVERARDRAIELGTAEQVALCDDLFAGRLDTPERMGDFFMRMGPLYSRRFDPEQAAASLSLTIFAPDALNRAHGPQGFLRDFDLRPELARITAPTLVLAGAYDWISPPDMSEEIHRLIPNSRYELFQESSHSIGNDEPERLMAVLQEFLRS